MGCTIFSKMFVLYLKNCAVLIQHTPSFYYKFIFRVIYRGYYHSFVWGCSIVLGPCHPQNCLFWCLFMWKILCLMFLFISSFLSSCSIFFFCGYHGNCIILSTSVNIFFACVCFGLGSSLFDYNCSVLFFFSFRLFCFLSSWFCFYYCNTTNCPVKILTCDCKGLFHYHSRTSQWKDKAQANKEFYWQQVR